MTSSVQPASVSARKGRLNRIDDYRRKELEAAQAIIERPEYYDPDSALSQWARAKLEETGG